MITIETLLNIVTYDFLKLMRNRNKEWGSSDKQRGLLPGIFLKRKQETEVGHGECRGKELLLSIMPSRLIVATIHMKYPLTDISVSFLLTIRNYLKYKQFKQLC